ncbi:Ig-like domain-containing protein, partial [Methylophilus aquaticus]
DKTIDAKVTVTDNAGNTASQSTQLTYSLDLTPPKAEIALDANFGGDGIINIEEAKATSITPVTGTVGGDAKLGDPVVVTINGKDYATTVVTRADGKLGFSVNVAGNELAADADKTIDAKVTVTDNAGNTASQSTQLTYSLDLTPPIATIALDANFGGDGIINIAESQPGVNQPVTGTVGGEAKLGDPVIVTINGKEYATTVVTRADGKLGFSVSVPGSELVADSDKTIDAKVTTTDTSGNVGVATTQLTYVVDVTAPIKPTIDNIFDDFGTLTGNVPSGGVADDATPTLTGKAEAGSTVTIFDGATKVGTAVADKDGKWTFTPATDINKGLHNYTVTATDNAGNTSVPSDSYAYTLNQSPIFTTLNGTVEVSEDGLPGGLIDAGSSNIIASGSLGISDPNGDLQSVTLTAPTTNYTSGGVAITWTGDNTGTLIGSANGKEVIRVTIEQDGDYAVRLSGPIDHPAAGEDTLALTFGVNAKDTDTTTTGSITVNVSDDAPTATNQTVTATGAAGTNIMLTIDVSGSMATRDGVNGTSRLDSVVASINNLLNQYANLGGDVRVMIVTFSDGSSQKTSSWVTIAEAKQVLSNLSAVGGTNYDSALDGSKSAFNSNGKVSGGQNVGYFFSDGEPNWGLETGDADRQAWEAFLKANDINEYALGIGSGVSATQVANSMNQIAYNGITEVDTDAIPVSNFAQLDAALSQTVPTPVSGALTDGGGFGADGGYVKSLVIEGTTYNFDGKTGALTVTGTNNSTYNTSTHELTVKTASGSFVVDMDNGKYTFTPGQTKVTLVDTTFDANGDSQQTPVPLGWFTDNPSGKIEILPSTTYGLSASYGNVLEIENFKGDGNLYTFINPGKNDTVTLSFDYAARSGYTSGTDSAIQVIVDGKVIDTVNTKNLTMSTFSYTFSGTGNQMRVEFKSVDTNSTGGLLDNIKITTSSTIQPAGSTTVTYTLSDNDGDTSTADLTLNVANNNTYVPTPAVAPEVGNAVSAAGLLTLPGLLNVDLLNFSSRQAFTATDVNNNISTVTISYSTLLGVTLGSAYMTYSQAVANELGLSVNYSQNSGFLGLLGASGKMVITAADGGTVDNLALNEFLSTVRVNEQLVDVSLLQSFTITATDSTNLQDSATSANLINIDLLSSASNSNVITGGDAGNNVLTGTSGNDIIYGFDGNDTLNGGAGNDILRGGAGNDTLNGNEGNDILIGGKGNDTLTGGVGVDVFKWDSGDEGVAGNPARDTITDFNKATVAQGGDVLDIRDLLQGENPNNLQNYMHFEKSGSDTIVHISSNGGFASDAHTVSGSFSSGNTTQQIVLSGVDLTSGQSSDAAIINNLLSQQKLIVDQ